MHAVLTNQITDILHFNDNKYQSTSDKKLSNSFTLCYFYCLATGERNPHMKQSGGAQISTTTWFWKISMYSQYYYHNLAAGKLRNIDSLISDNMTEIKFNIFGRAWL